jgi:hypothetical protein
MKAATSQSSDRSAKQVEGDRLTTGASAPTLELLEASGEVDAQDFSDAFGESLGRALDLDTWTQGGDLSAILEGLEAEVAAAVQAEDEYRRHVRERILPMIKGAPSAPACAGWYQATTGQIQRTQTHVLFNGGVEACDGTASVHDTLPLTIMQIGVCLVSYAGEQGAYLHRLYRRDLRARGKDPFEDLVAMLERRTSRSGVGQSGKRDELSELARRGIMAYAERAVLLRKATAPWRMGHGNPAPYELLTGSGSMDLLAKGLEVIEELVLQHQRFVYVPSAPGERGLLTIGNALRPLEFAIVDSAESRMYPIIFEGHLRGKHRARAEKFYRDVAPNIVAGVFRTSRMVPAQIFYAHKDHAEEAALVAMADSVLQAHRGFPILIDIADSICRSTFGTDVFTSTIQSTYAANGDPLTYLGERETRR